MFEVLAELNAINVRVDRIVGAAVFDRGEGLRIPSLLMGGTAREVNVDQRFGDTLLRLVEFGLGTSLDLEKFGERESKTGGEADLHELTAVSRAVVEES